MTFEKHEQSLKRCAAITILILAFASGITDAFGQYESEKDASIPLKHFYIKRQGISTFRRILSKVTWGFSTGYGRTAFKHDLSGFEILQSPGVDPLIKRVGAPATEYYSNWFNEVQLFTDPVPPGTTFSSEDDEIGFETKAFNIPLKLTAHVEFLERYRIGAGYSFEYTNLGDFTPTSHGKQIRDFAPDASSFFLKKYFGMIGASVYRYENYLLVVDANIGGYSLGKKFDKGSMKKGVFVNLGVAVEREMSEYFRLFARPSYELKGFTMNVPGGSGIKHKFNAFYINVGATYRIPELRRCFLKECHIQINHAHGDREYRSRRHPIYKKQNPHYGENYPTLIKYKGKNKKKLNPY